MRRETGEEEVRVKVLYCGVCHSDLHCLKNEWHSSIYPLVPGYATPCLSSSQNIFLYSLKKTYFFIDSLHMYVRNKISLR